MQKLGRGSSRTGQNFLAQLWAHHHTAKPSPVPVPVACRLLANTGQARLEACPTAPQRLPPIYFYGSYSQAERCPQHTDPLLPRPFISDLVFKLSPSVCSPAGCRAQPGSDQHHLVHALQVGSAAPLSVCCMGSRVTQMK